MTIVSPIAIACPCCKHQFEGHMLVSTNTFGPHTTELRARSAGADPLSFMVTTCPNCGFSGYASEFTNEVSLEVKELVLANFAPSVHRYAHSYRLSQFKWAARVAEWCKDPELKTARLYLCAAWRAGDARMKDEAKHLRSEAIRRFETALQTRQVGRSEVPVVIYLVGELYRRIGQPDETQAWFARAIQATRWRRKLNWLKRLAQRQATRPSTCFENVMLQRNKRGVEHLQGTWWLEGKVPYEVEGRRMVCTRPASTGSKESWNPKRVVEIARTECGFSARAESRDRSLREVNWYEAELFWEGDEGVMLYWEDESALDGLFPPFLHHFHRKPVRTGARWLSQSV